MFYELHFVAECSLELLSLAGSCCLSTHLELYATDEGLPSQETLVRPEVKGSQQQ